MPSLARSEAGCLIVGGGLYSLITAGALLNSGVDADDILIVEGSEFLGGQFQSERVEGDFRLDRGTRILYETGDQRADHFIRTIMDRCSVQVLEGNRKDIGGTIEGGLVNSGSPYPTLRTCSMLEKVKILGEILVRADNSLSISERKIGSLCHYLEKRFGPTARELIHEPIIRQIMGMESRFLSDRLTEILPLDRLVVFSQSVMTDLARSEFMKSRLAFPDQLNLPNLRLSDFRGYYPSLPGIQSFVEIAEDILTEAGVRIMKSTAVDSFSDVANNGVTVLLSSRGESKRFEAIRVRKALLWTSGIHALARCSQLSDSEIPSTSLRRTSIIHLAVPNVSELEDSYYVYNHDSSLQMFRITNYSSYCPNAQSDGWYPITVEAFSVDSESPELVIRRTIAEVSSVLKLRREDVRLLGSENSFVGGIPVPLISDEESWTRITSQIYDRASTILYASGLGSGRPKFLGREIVNDNLKFVDNLMA